MEGTNSLIHSFGIFSFIAYLFYVGIQLFRGSDRRLRKLASLSLFIGLVSNLILIYQVLQTDIAKLEDSIFIQSHPSLLLLLVATVIFLLVFIFEPGSLFVRKIISLVTFFIFILGALFLHQAIANRIYELSPILIVHILVSLISQVYLVFIFLISLVLVFVDKNLKSKKITSSESDYPPLLPTEKLWLRVIGQGIAVLGLSIFTGLLQVGGFTYSGKLLFAFMGLIGLLLAYLAYKFTTIKASMISLSLAVLILLIFVLQILSRNQVVV